MMAKRITLRCPICAAMRTLEVVKDHGQYSARCPTCNNTVWFKKEEVQDALVQDALGQSTSDPEQAPAPELLRGKAWIAAEAARLVSGDRNSQHGDTLDNHECIAHAWNAILWAKYHKYDFTPLLDALDVANMMEALKIARRYTGGHNLDDYVDGAGYAAVAGDIAERVHRQKS